VVARFSREAKAASRISHPHAVSVTDFGEAENGVVFLVMEYLDGQTLKEVIRNEARCLLIAPSKSCARFPERWMPHINKALCTAI